MQATGFLLDIPRVEVLINSSRLSSKLIVDVKLLPIKAVLHYTQGNACMRECMLCCIKFCFHATCKPRLMNLPALVTAHAHQARCSAVQYDIITLYYIELQYNINPKPWRLLLYGADGASSLQEALRLLELQHITTCVVLQVTK